MSLTCPIQWYDNEATRKPHLLLCKKEEVTPNLISTPTKPAGTLISSSGVFQRHSILIDQVLRGWSNHQTCLTLIPKRILLQRPGWFTTSTTGIDTQELDFKEANGTSSPRRWSKELNGIPSSNCCSCCSEDKFFSFLSTWKIPDSFLLVLFLNYYLYKQDHNNLFKRWISTPKARSGHILLKKGRQS